MKKIFLLYISLILSLNHSKSFSSTKKITTIEAINKIISEIQIFSPDVWQKIGKKLDKKITQEDIDNYTLREKGINAKYEINDILAKIINNLGDQPLGHHIEKIILLLENPEIYIWHFTEGFCGDEKTPAKELLNKTLFSLFKKKIERITLNLAKDNIPLILLPSALLGYGVYKFHTKALRKIKYGGVLISMAAYGLSQIKAETFIKASKFVFDTIPKSKIHKISNIDLSKKKELENSSVYEIVDTLIKKFEEKNNSNLSITWKMISHLSQVKEKDFQLINKIAILLTKYLNHPHRPLYESSLLKAQDILHNKKNDDFADIPNEKPPIKNSIGIGKNITQVFIRSSVNAIAYEATQIYEPLIKTLAPIAIDPFQAGLSLQENLSKNLTDSGLKKIGVLKKISFKPLFDSAFFNDQMVNNYST
jgi:hypothetical protein